MSLTSHPTSGPAPSTGSPRFDARHLDAQGFPEFLRYLENNPVKAGLVQRAVDWRWSSARAHYLDEDPDGLLTFDLWRHCFGNPETIAREWRIYLEGPIDEARRNAAILASYHSGSRLNRPLGRYGPSPPG
ncbi:MAG: hypothetical protein K2X03_18495 [Bryobacteraceae bacterium]|nr:hypothetical protein [Bryobacteraceae bacterium]